MSGPDTVARVVIADDQRMVRAGLRSLLEADPSIAVVGEADDGVDAVALVARTRPDVVLLDVRMPRMDGLEATRLIRGRFPATGVIILTTFGLDEYVVAAVRGGASGFLLKDGDADDLIRAVHAVARGDALMAPEALRALLDEFAARPGTSAADRARLAALTPREREVLRLVAAGRTNAEISDELAVSTATTKTHISNLLMKLQARDRAALVIAAYEGGLVTAREGGGPRRSP